MITGGNLHDGWTYTGGAFELGFNLQWTTMTLAGGALDFLEVTDEQLSEWVDEYLPQVDNLSKRMWDLPLDDLPLFEELAPYYDTWLDHPTYDDYWKEVDLTRQADSISTPMLDIGGWYDKFTRGAFDIADSIAQTGNAFVNDNHHLVFGPWEHLTQFSAVPIVTGERQFALNAAMPNIVDELMLPWFSHHLQDVENDVADFPRIKYYQMGSGEWRQSNDWPPAGETLTLYLNSNGNANTRNGDGKLTKKKPANKQPSDSYVYDPEDPVPSCGGNSRMHPAGDAGVQDQSDIELRDDVLIYTTPKLTEAIEILGRANARLTVKSSAPDTDFTAKLVDVEPDGYCANVTEGILRARYRNSMSDPEYMEPGEQYQLSVELWPTAYTFKPGHSIRLEISSSNFPRFDRNPNKKMPVAEATEDDMRSATNQIIHTDENPSRISLPVTN